MTTATYVGVYAGNGRYRVQRTARSLALANRRRSRRFLDVFAQTVRARALGYTEQRTAQEVADEQKLSRSKEYPERGQREAARRLGRELMRALRA